MASTRHVFKLYERLEREAAEIIYIDESVIFEHQAHGCPMGVVTVCPMRNWRAFNKRRFNAG